MTSKSPPSASRSDSTNNLQMVAFGDTNPAVPAVVEALKQKLTVERHALVKKRIGENSKKLLYASTYLFEISHEWRQVALMDGNVNLNVLSKRQKDADEMANDLFETVDGGGPCSFQDEDDKPAPSVVLLGPGCVMPDEFSNNIHPRQFCKSSIKIQVIIFPSFIRNQRMTEDQSIVGQRRIYYDQNGGETLICSDSEEEAVEGDEGKREFSDSENFIIRKTIEQLGLSDDVLDSLAKCLYSKPSEIKASYEFMVEKIDSRDDTSDSLSYFLEKDLDAALDSFDNLFCRRCLVFDCKLHGCSQDLVFPIEKQNPWSPLGNENIPCSPHCYRLLHKQDCVADVSLLHENSDGSRSIQFSSVENPNKNLKRLPGCELQGSQKRQKKAATSDLIGSRGTRLRLINFHSDVVKENRNETTLPKGKGSSGGEGSESTDQAVQESESTPKLLLGQTNKYPHNMIGKKTSQGEEFAEKKVSIRATGISECWRTIEANLFDKGIEIFGRNSCLIARNTLSGLRTCEEVYQYMRRSESDSSLPIGDANSTLTESHLKADVNEGNVVRRRSKFLRRRGKVRRLGKSAAYQSYKKRISDSKNMLCRQYNPCSCQTDCGSECSCLVNGTCCEKYCGCPKSCKNRFRGCHCAKSQCRSRQCPCFAANRECDPDICRNCWVSCGDGSLGTPCQPDDNCECHNMKLLLKQQKRVLLGRSDVSGWGAFLKNTVGKNEYLGEYTGELISHREADKRGKIYDRENSSFLFNLNDQFVLDAFRKGDKLKFANHSPNPNCYAKVLMVAGDHRVGIFAKERIVSGEELFYDYSYEPDRAPAWARKPEASNSKKDYVTLSAGRAKKVA